MNRQEIILPFSIVFDFLICYNVNGEDCYGKYKRHKKKGTNIKWKFDADNHWNECECGDKANVAAHADTNNDEKCDVCGYAMPKAENDPSAPTPDLPDTNTDKTTEKDDKITDSQENKKDETDAKDKGGCTSSAAFSALAIVGIIGTVLVIKKKED